MLDVARLVALILAGSACIRPRYWLGFVAILAIAAVDAAPMVLPLLHRETAPPSVFYAFVLLFWGPSGLPTPATSWPALDVIGASPIARTALTTALAWFAMSRACGRSKPLRPETMEARSWDKVGLRFLFVGVVDCLLLVVGVLLRYFDA